MAGNFYFFLLLLLLTALSLMAGVSGAAHDGGVNLELWCVAKNNAEDAALQGALDWACGPGGTDCSAIQQGGRCYFPSDIGTMASYAFNSYYLTHGLTDDSCYFGNTAALISLNPSKGNCKFPSSSSVKNGSHSGTSTTVGLGPTYEDLNGCSRITMQCCRSKAKAHSFQPQEKKHFGTNSCSDLY
ncbi:PLASMODESMATA CALLOSE-BINDING PROTEIN 5 isoform X2 [Punica granatum]|uniref:PLASMODESMATA CALLOSE-BINDING PROTEIN 5 isoform X2 n=1 Tax=Punica granatum TaxID=22663 RepID=A0A6P8CRR3_PUNGR|nr:PLASMODESMATA CALLOSE-BINDING PROTEIN 5 isoform X2 [Punica granatum]